MTPKISNPALSFDIYNKNNPYAVFSSIQRIFDRVKLSSNKRDHGFFKDIVD